MKKILTIALFFLLVACTTEEDTVLDVVDLVPLDGEISGWTRSSAMIVCDNETQLYDEIDGEGQVYIDNGFVRSAFQDFLGDVGAAPQVDLTVWIFDQGDTANAKAVYDEVAIGTEIEWTDEGHAGVEARYLLEAGVITPYYLLDFWDDRFYVWLYINDGTDAGLDVAKLFALNISQTIQGSIE
jgi:hypothetical protein